jgi:hypothetical protein
MVSMLYLHFSNSNSLDEISNGLRLSGGNLNHLGIIGQHLQLQIYINAVGI